MGISFFCISHPAFTPVALIFAQYLAKITTRFSPFSRFNWSVFRSSVYPTLPSLRSPSFLLNIWPRLPLDSAHLVILIGRYFVLLYIPLCLHSGRTSFSQGLPLGYLKWPFARGSYIFSHFWRLSAPPFVHVSLFCISSGLLFRFRSGLGPVAPGGCFAFPFNLTSYQSYCVSVFLQD